MARRERSTYHAERMAATTTNQTKSLRVNCGRFIAPFQPKTDFRDLTYYRREREPDYRRQVGFFCRDLG